MIRTQGIVWAVAIGLMGAALACGSEVVLEPQLPEDPIVLRLEAASPTQWEVPPGRRAFPVVRVRDISGYGVRGATVAFYLDESSKSAGASVQRPEMLTDDNGFASPLWTPGTYRTYPAVETLRAVIRGKAGAAVDAVDTVVFRLRIEELPTPRPLTGRIAFVRTIGLTIGTGGIFTVDPNGSIPMQLTYDYDSQPAWSPDGSLLAFVRNNSQLCVLPSDAATPHCIAVEITGRAAWSPDGTRLAFIDTGSVNGVVRLYVTDMREVTAISELPRSVRCSGSDASWSPMDRIAFIPCDGLYTINPDGTGLQGLPNPLSDNHVPDVASWSPNGQKLAVGFKTPSCSQWEGCDTLIGTMNADGSDFRVLVRSEAWWVWEPVWSPDGTAIAYTAGGCYGECSFELRIIEADGTGDRAMVTQARQPSWGR